MSLKKPIETKIKESKDWNCGHGHSHTTTPGTYGLGVIGAAFYFFPMVTSFQEGVIAFCKSLFWPAMLVYQALTLLKL